MKSNNSGFSFVEVIVVIAIMVVLTSSSVQALSYLTRGDIKKATKTLYSFIASSRTNSMAKSGEWIFEVSHDGTQYVLRSLCDGVEYDMEKLSNRVGSITINGDALTSIKFAKNTGAVTSVNGIDVVAGYADIVISISGNERTLRLYYLTGKIEQI